MVTSKLRIRLGDVEIDCEGSEDFLKQELPGLLKTAMELHGSAGAVTRQEQRKATDGEPHKVGSMTTGSIAAKLDVKTGPDLAIAAAARLALVLKAEPFSRKQLLEEMKSATAYYDKNHSANLTSILKRVLKDDRLTETSKNTFALTASTRAEVEKKLANH